MRRGIDILNIKKNKIKWLRLLLLSLILFLSACGPKKMTYRDPDEISYEVTEKTDIKDQKAVEEAVKVVQKNIQAAQEEDIDAYLSTIVKKGHKETKKEFKDFFEDYDLEHTIMGITVLEEDKETMLLEVTQQSVATHTAENVDEYKDHIAVANHVLVKEEGKWKISETTMVDNYFIE